MKFWPRFLRWAPAEGETVAYQAEDADDYIGTQETNHSGAGVINDCL